MGGFRSLASLSIGPVSFFKSKIGLILPPTVDDIPLTILSRAVNPRPRASVVKILHNPLGEKLLAMDHENGWPGAFVDVVDANPVNFLIIFLKQGMETLSHGSALLREGFQSARTTVFSLASAYAPGYHNAGYFIRPTNCAV